jgi:TolA-binding protein
MQWFILTLLMCGAAVPLSLGAAATPEEIAYDAAARSFQGGLFDRAEREFAEFARQFPKSERLAEVILIRAQAQYKLGQYTNLISLLSANLAQAGKLADKYRYWLAEAHFQRGDYAAAAAMYAELLKEHADSFLRSQASYGEAMAWFKLGNLTNTIQRLQQTNSPFQIIAQAQPNDESVIRGYLLLAETLMLQQDYRGAEATLSLLINRQLSPQLDWDRQFLLVRVQLADQRPDAALKNLTNLVSLAAATGSRTNQAETVLLQGQVLQAAQQPAAAVQVYEQNLETLPSAQRRSALLKLVELNLLLTNTVSAAQHLERFITQYPQDPALDQARMTLGELRLKEYLARQQAPVQTNQPQALAATIELLQQAQTNFDLLIAAFPQSPLAGHAHLNRGWCLWEGGNIAESMAAFKEAAARLPPSTNQLVARFKWADAQFQLKDFTNACQNYQLVVDQGPAMPGFPAALVEHALYQIARASLELNDLSGATNAIKKILDGFPQSQYADRSLMLAGQWLSRHGQSAAARQMFADLLQRFPKSALAPDVQLALASTYGQEADWPAAIRHYDDWVTRHTNHFAMPQVEFDRAWAYDRAGLSTNALCLFSNYVARFPTHTLAPLAQYWVGDFFFNQAQFARAEENYQRLYQNTNWPLGELTYQARLAAGRAAYARQGFPDATNYFTTLINLLINDTNSPTSLLSEAYFALGDTMIAMPTVEATNTLKKFGEAINAFSKIPETDPLAPRAWGRIADCHLQLASQDATRYLHATNFYHKVINFSAADIAARSQAEMGLATVFEKLALAKTASDQAPLLQLVLDHCLNIVHGKNLRPGEKPNPFWVAAAGHKAASLLEAQNKWSEAVNLYQRLLTVLPNAPNLDKKLDQAKKKL